MSFEAVLFLNNAHENSLVHYTLMILGGCEFFRAPEEFSNNNSGLSIDSKLGQFSL